MKLCKDCKHYVGTVWDEANGNTYHGCRHPDTVDHDLVTGDVTMEDCKALRWDDRQCGPDGKLFEPREPVYAETNETILTAKMTSTEQQKLLRELTGGNSFADYMKRHPLTPPGPPIRLIREGEAPEPPKPAKRSLLLAELAELFAAFCIILTLMWLVAQLFTAKP